jgi:hypothetical protein
MFIQKQVFDPKLVSTAVYINGASMKDVPFQGLYLVQKVDNEFITVVEYTGAAYELHIDNFTSGKHLSIKECEVHREHPFEQLELVEEVEPGEAAAPIEKPKRKMRTEEQIFEDRVALECILQFNKDPLDVKRIIFFMQKQGHVHWNNNNATGYIQTMIKRGSNIQNSSYGFYQFVENSTATAQTA